MTPVYAYPEPEKEVYSGWRIQEGIKISDVARMHELRALGVKKKEICKIYDISYSTLWRYFDLSERHGFAACHH